LAAVAAAVAVSLTGELTSWSDSARLITVAAVGLLLVAVGTPYALLRKRPQPRTAGPLRDPGSKDPYFELLQTQRVPRSAYLLHEDPAGDVLIVGSNPASSRVLRFAEDSTGRPIMEAVSSSWPHPVNAQGQRTTHDISATAAC
jgi:hypothetical protein